MGLKVGDTAPDFTLMSDSREPVTLSSFRGKQVILFFYPKDDTPGCARQACGFRDNFPAIEAANGVVLGISPDSVESHIKFKKKQRLQYPLLSDPDHAVISKYSAWGEKNNFGRKYMGVIRSHVVVDEDGKIADIHIKIKPEDSVEAAVDKVTR